MERDIEMKTFKVGMSVLVQTKDSAFIGVLVDGTGALTFQKTHDPKMIGHATEEVIETFRGEYAFKSDRELRGLVMAAGAKFWETARMNREQLEDYMTDHLVHIYDEKNVRLSMVENLSPVMVWLPFREVRSLTSVEDIVADSTLSELDFSVSDELS